MQGLQETTKGLGLSKYISFPGYMTNVGQKIKVKIIDILEDKQLYRLSIKQVGTRSRQNVRQLKSPYNAKKRYKIPLDQQDFTPLQDKLEEWIEEETMKINNEVK